MGLLALDLGSLSPFVCCHFVKMLFKSTAYNFEALDIFECRLNPGGLGLVLGIYLDAGVEDRHEGGISFEITTANSSRNISHE